MVAVEIVNDDQVKRANDFRDGGHIGPHLIQVCVGRKQSQINIAQALSLQD
jgi:hypothetical protein